MAQVNLPPDEDNARFEREIDEILSNANPNPARSGCLPRATLSELAQRRRSLRDPGWQHLLKCSPCYRDFLALREERARLPLPLAPWRGRRLAAIALVLLSIAAAGSFWLYRGQSQMPMTTPTPSASLTPVQQAEIDLRKHVVMRSEQDARDELPPVPIPIGIVELTLLLPVGSEPGQYEIQLLDANLTSRASARGVGERRNYVVTVKATMDTRSIVAGRYQLAVRREGDGWRLYPTQIG